MGEEEDKDEGSRVGPRIASQLYLAMTEQKGMAAMCAESTGSFEGVKKETRREKRDLQGLNPFSFCSRIHFSISSLELAIIDILSCIRGAKNSEVRRKRC